MRVRARDSVGWNACNTHTTSQTSTRHREGLIPSRDSIDRFIAEQTTTHVPCTRTHITHLSRRSRQVSRTRVFVRASRASELRPTPFARGEEWPGKFKTIRASASSPFAGRSDATIPLPEYEPLVNNKTRVIVLLAGTRRTRELFERNFHRSHRARTNRRSNDRRRPRSMRVTSYFITARERRESSSRTISLGIACTRRVVVQPAESGLVSPVGL